MNHTLAYAGLGSGTRRKNLTLTSTPWSELRAGSQPHWTLHARSMTRNKNACHWWAYDKQHAQLAYISSLSPLHAPCSSRIGPPVYPLHPVGEEESQRDEGTGVALERRCDFAYNLPIVDHIHCTDHLHEHTTVSKQASVLLRQDWRAQGQMLSAHLIGTSLACQ